MRLLIDCGTGVLAKLQHFLPLTELTAVVISHMHADHFFDLIPLRYAYKYGPVPPEAVGMARRLFEAAGLDVGGIEYLETTDGRRVFYDVNANSNLRPAIAWEFGFDPFERVVDFLIEAIDTTTSGESATREGLSLAG